MWRLSRWLPLIAAVVAAGGALLADPVLAATARQKAVPAGRTDVLPKCNWDRPGRNPFTGDVVAAVDRYTDIPALVRVKLKERMQARQYDDIADIRRDSIRGEKHEYKPEIRDMHFGGGRVCREVTRKRWTAKTHERGLVYCEGEHCILVPTVCRNVSRVTRKPADVAGTSIAPPAGGVPADPRREAALGSGDRPAPATSSFSEAVAGAVVPLFGGEGGMADPGVGPGVPGSGGPPGAVLLPAPLAGGGPAADPPLASETPAPGGGGGGGGSGGGGGGGSPGVVVLPPVGPIGDGPGVDPGTPPIVAVPEPSTWASLGLGLAVLAWVARRQRRTGAPRCATQKRS